MWAKLPIGLLLVLVITSPAFSLPFFCFRTYSEKIAQLQEEVPEAHHVYSKSEQKKAFRAMEDYEAEWKPSVKEPSLEKGVQPFLDIEKAITEIEGRSGFSPESFVRNMRGWPKDPELAPYLYSQLTRFGTSADALLKELIKTRLEFKDVFLMEAPMGSLVTFSFEKETHKATAGLWYRPKTMPEEEWFALNSSERERQLWEAGRGNIVPTSKKPGYLSNAHFERAMSAMDGGFNYGRPPIEFAHKKFEVQLSETMKQIREVSDTIQESSQFHLHVVFYHPAPDKEGFAKMGDWWRKVNDYLYLYGIERGLHPTKLTELPEKNPSDLSETGRTIQTKYFGAGLRSDMYGEGREGGYARVGIELRDITRNIDELESIARRVAHSAKDRVWLKGMGYETRPFSLEPKKPEYAEAFRKHLESYGVSGPEMELFLKLDPKLAVPFMPFASSGDPIMTKALAAYTEEMLTTLKEYRGYVEKGEEVHPEDLRTALRMGLTAWAKIAKPSRFFSDY